MSEIITAFEDKEPREVIRMGDWTLEIRQPSKGHWYRRDQVQPRIKKYSLYERLMLKLGIMKEVG